jgi:hypothetical protein
LLADSIFSDGGIGDHIPKPKWMREATYDRRLEEIFAAEDVVYDQGDPRPQGRSLLGR